MQSKIHLSSKNLNFLKINEQFIRKRQKKSDEKRAWKSIVADQKELSLKYEERGQGMRLKNETKPHK